MQREDVVHFGDLAVHTVLNGAELAYTYVEDKNGNVTFLDNGSELNDERTLFDRIKIENNPYQKYKKLKLLQNQILKKSTFKKPPYYANGNNRAFLYDLTKEISLTHKELLINDAIETEQLEKEKQKSEKKNSEMHQQQLPVTESSKTEIRKKIVDTWEQLTLYPMDTDKLLKYRINGTGKIKSVHCDTLGLSEGEFKVLFVILSEKPVNKIREYTKKSLEVHLSGIRKKFKEYFGPEEDPLGRGCKSPIFQISQETQVYATTVYKDFPADHC